MNRILIGLFAVLGTLQVASCAGAMATTPPAPPACPPVKAYTAQQQAALAKAVQALPAENPLVGAMIDYGALRAAARACKG